MILWQLDLVLWNNYYSCCIKTLVSLDHSFVTLRFKAKNSTHDKSFWIQMCFSLGKFYIIAIFYNYLIITFSKFYRWSWLILRSTILHLLQITVYWLICIIYDESGKKFRFSILIEIIHTSTLKFYYILLKCVITTRSTKNTNNKKWAYTVNFLMSVVTYFFSNFYFFFFFCLSLDQGMKEGKTYSIYVVFLWKFIWCSWMSQSCGLHLLSLFIQ